MKYLIFAILVATASCASLNETVKSAKEVGGTLIESTAKKTAEETTKQKIEPIELKITTLAYMMKRLSTDTNDLHTDFVRSENIRAEEREQQKKINKKVDENQQKLGKDVKKIRRDQGELAQAFADFKEEWEKLKDSLKRKG